jgi:hypothetical protein
MMKVLRNEEHEPLAMFELEDDGTITTNYVRPRIGEAIERDGILFNDKVLRPSDGAPFMEALDAEYAASSRYYIQTVDGDLDD